MVQQPSSEPGGASSAGSRQRSRGSRVVAVVVEVVVVVEIVVIVVLTGTIPDRRSVVVLVQPTSVEVVVVSCAGSHDWGPLSRHSRIRSLRQRAFLVPTEAHCAIA